MPNVPNTRLTPLSSFPAEGGQRAGLRCVTARRLRPLVCFYLIVAAELSAGSVLADQRQTRAATAGCDDSNLLADRLPSAENDATGHLSLVTDGTIAPEGDVWDAPTAVILARRSASITYDLGRLQQVSAIYLQADANDTYEVAGSLDGRPETFRLLAIAANVVEQGPGLRGRTLRIAPSIVRFLRVGGAVGDAFYSVSEFAAYCNVPSPFPPTMHVSAVPPATPPVSIADAGRDTPTGARTGWIEIVFGAGLLVFGGQAILFRRSAAARSSLNEPRDRTFIALMGLFMASGCAALIYEIVWFQMLQLALGASAVALGVLLGTFMGGMCGGSLTVSYFISRDRHPLKMYAVLELGVGVCGVVLLVVLPRVQTVYSAAVGLGVPGFLLRGLLAAVCLLPPTMMMGATLPTVARWIDLRTYFSRT